MTGAPSPWGTGYTQFCGANRERGPTYGNSLPISCELVPHSWTSVLVNGIALRIAGDWFTYDTELQGWSISGGIGGSFAAFGLAGVAPGFVPLDLSANADGASATARIRIPLGGAQ